MKTMRSLLLGLSLSGAAWALQGCQSFDSAEAGAGVRPPPESISQPASEEIRERIRNLQARWDREPIPIGLQRQTFYDDVIIARKKGAIERVRGEVKKLNGGQPVLTADRSWETVNYKWGVSGLAVNRDAETGKFRMWYTAGLVVGGDAVEMGYAESDDGIVWTKPAGLRTFNNIVHRRAWGQGVYEDRQDPRPDHRLKMVFASYDQPYTNISVLHGVMIAHSRDGRSWKNYPPDYFIGDCRSDTQNSLFWDEDIQAYRLVTRANELPRGVKQYAIPRLEDSVFKMKRGRGPQWTFVQEKRMPLAKGEIYHFFMQKYGGLYLAYVSVLQNDNANRLFVMVSRDGVSWNFDAIELGGDFLRIGPPSYFDEGSVWPPNSDLITVGDQHWIYYVGSRGRHVMPPPAQSDEPPMFAIGLAAIRVDGFFHLRMSGIGLVETRTFEWAGDRLEVNCNATRGKLWVEIVDATGKPLAGLSSSEADVVTQDAVHHVVSWKGSSDLSALRGRHVRLRFLFDGNVDLHAFQVLAGK